jgi:putative ABC transport system permease protein
LYGIFGGLSGLAIGFIFCYLASPYLTQNLFTAFLKGSEVGGRFDPGLILGTLLFSFLVSIVSGVYPAWKASKLTPVEAISYE